MSNTLLAYQVECPTCGACVGQKCWTVKGPLRIARPHPDRYIVALSEPPPEAGRPAEQVWSPVRTLQSGRRRCQARRKDGLQCMARARGDGCCTSHGGRLTRDERERKGTV